MACVQIAALSFRSLVAVRYSCRRFHYLHRCLSPPPRCLFPVSHTFIIAYFSFLLSELFHSLPLPPLLSSILAPSSMSASTVTFVFDSALPPQQYTKLVQPDGIIYKLIQRLEEKHGGDDYVRIYSFSSPSLFFT